MRRTARALRVSFERRVRRRSWASCPSLPGAAPFFAPAPVFSHIFSRSPRGGGIYMPAHKRIFPEIVAKCAACGYHNNVARFRAGKGSAPDDVIVSVRLVYRVCRQPRRALAVFSPFSLSEGLFVRFLLRSLGRAPERGSAARRLAQLRPARFIRSFRFYNPNIKRR